MRSVVRIFQWEGCVCVCGGGGGGGGEGRGSLCATPIVLTML